MEEIRTTEALDREILEDARKKADRILRTAEQSARSAEADWKKKTEEAGADLGRLYAERGERRIREIMARLPLDKRRARAERADRHLTECMTAYLSSLPRKKIISLLARELSLRASSLSGMSGIVAKGSGLSAAEAEALLKPLLPDGSWRLAQGFGSDGIAGIPELVLDAADVRVTASVGAAAAELLLEKRAELARALLGEGAVND